MSQDVANIPSLSIITVVRNNKSGLVRTRDSLSIQEATDFEWIVIDGASTDDTLSTIRGDALPKKLRNKVSIISEPDDGIYDGMNKGLRLSTGRYVQFLNAGDEYFDEQSISTVLGQINLNDKHDLLFFGQIKRYPRDQNVEVDAHDARRWMRHSLPASHQACIICRDLHIRYPYDLTYKSSADYHAVASMYAAGGSAISLKSTLVFSDKSTDSASFKHTRRVIEDCIRVQVEVFDMGALEIFRSLSKRMLPIVYWKLTPFIPGLSILVEKLGRGRRWQSS